jgi:hypothetical protein
MLFFVMSCTLYLNERSWSLHTIMSLPLYTHRLQDAMQTRVEEGRA